MTKPIRKVAVLGSGVMGGGIAAHLANAGVPVLLLDLKDFAAQALEKLKKSRPASFSHVRNSVLITTGNLETDLAKVADCDLIVEAIIEKLEIKRDLFAKLDALLTGETLVASNTSGLRIADMVVGRSDRFRQNFLITHFFNPPRYMKLLELVAGEDTSAAAKARAEAWGKEQMGKGIVWAKDTPNFVANRIGTHSMMAAIHLMLEKGLAPEDLDAITGVPMGHPKSASFRTGDLVGLDTLVHVVDNCHASLTADEDREVFTVPPYIREMIKKGQLGDKSKGGFYKKVGADIQTLDPKTGEYRAKGGSEDIAKATKKISKIEDPRARVKALVATEGGIGEFAWKALSKGLAYAARRIGEITDDPKAIDDGMKWGYNWELGPFETWDALGFAETTARLKADGLALPAWVDKMVAAGAKGFYDGDRVWSPAAGDYVRRAADPREVTLDVMRKGGGPVLKNAGAEAWDLGDGVLGLTFKSKSNSIDADVIKMIHEAVDKAETDFRGLLVYNTGEHFCVGANLFAVVMAAGAKQWDGLREMIRGYQYATQRMKYATVPVVAAPFGMTVGGGLELCFGADAVQASLETYAGLVEVGVGLIPGGAGTLNMLWRSLEGVPEGVEIDTYAFVTQVFKNIALAKVALSADEAKAAGFFRTNDGVSFDRARQLWEAKQRVIGLANSGYHAPSPRAYKLPGESGIATLKMMVNTLVAGNYASEHDAKIAVKLAEVLCGGANGNLGPNSEDKILELEREAFLSLCGEPLSQARMQYMLQNNKPLRN
ncbi:MAG TPA: 3-hydroxyacyl-CoA dehydrogenase/enoyl-CoA hydratase family protein [Kofleriaceae bacterium]|nr:3-hydroxyacyl-CoA dehydrogenase/enoyl-CoA hydratase family protein [Kofleriaceae bacterium]